MTQAWPILEFLFIMEHIFSIIFVISTIVCAGNRRKEFSKPVQGLMWNAGAVSTAEW